MKIISPHKARWDCRSCGSCCQGFSFGPVSEGVVQRLQEKNIEGKWAPAAKYSWLVERDIKGENQLFFRQKDGHCIFLREDKLCAIHAELGAEYKPWFCRSYPFHIVEEPRGLAIHVREDCGGLHKSFADGLPLMEQFEEVLALTPTVSRQRFDMKQIIVLPGMAVSMETWLQAEGVLVECCQNQDSPTAMVVAIREALLQMAGRELPPSSAENYDQSLRAFAMELYKGIQQVQKQAPAFMNDSLCRLTEQLSQVLQNWERQKKVVTPECVQYLNLILRGRILGKSFASLGGLPSALGFFLAEIAIMQLLSEAEEPLNSQDIGPLFSAWRRLIMLPPVWTIVRQLRPLLISAFIYAE